MESTQRGEAQFRSQFARELARRDSLRLPLRRAGSEKVLVNTPSGISHPHRSFLQARLLPFKFGSAECFASHYMNSGVVDGEVVLGDGDELGNREQEGLKTGQLFTRRSKKSKQISQVNTSSTFTVILNLLGYVR